MFAKLIFDKFCVTLASTGEGGGGVDPNFVLHISSSWAEIRLHTKEIGFIGFLEVPPRFLWVVGWSIMCSHQLCFWVELGL